MSIKKEKTLRMLSYVGLGALALVTAVIVVFAVQMPATVSVPRYGGGAQVNK